MLKKCKLATILLTLFVGILAGCSNDSKTASEGTQNSDGTAGIADKLNIAMGAQPPSLDPHVASAIATRDVAMQIFETLVTIDKDYKPVPMLAESIDISEDGKTYTFSLRQGVKFHNGKEMTSEDVVASMNRFLEKGGSTFVTLQGGVFKADGGHTVILEVENPSPLILTTLANRTPMAAIMPKETIESAPSEGINEYIGTGPLKFVEWKQDQYIKLTKNDDYQSLESESSGQSGKKEVFIKDIFIHFVSDTSTQIAGLQTGEYDLLLEAPNDNYELLVNDPSIETIIHDYGPYNLVYNKHAGILTKVEMRQAINAGIDPEEILRTSFMHEDIYELDPSYMSPKSADWYSDAGKENYNQNNPEKAKELLKKAGYNGEPVRIVTTRDYAHIYNTGVVLQQQLEKIGIKVSLEIYDWPTAMNIRNNEPEKWDVFITGMPFVLTPLELYPFTLKAYIDPNNPKVDNLMNEIKNAQNQEEATKKWNELQEYTWEYLPVSKIGNFNKISAFKDYVKDYSYQEGPILWKTKVQK
jgi:peptide/nickel transport system substrate-binding protein